MSKSLGNVIDPLALRNQFGTDAVRWYLMREMPTGSDASYTPERFLTRYNELANVLGNLASRTTSMVLRYRAGTVPGAEGRGLEGPIATAVDSYRAAMDVLRVHEALDAAMELARVTNGYVESREPWALAKDPNRADALDEVLATLTRALVVLVALFFPVMPRKMEELAEGLGLRSVPRIDEALAGTLGNLRPSRLPPLFPRLEVEAAD